MSREVTGKEKEELIKSFKNKKIVFHKSFDKGWQISLCKDCGIATLFMGLWDKECDYCGSEKSKIYSLDKVQDFTLKQQEVLTKHKGFKSYKKMLDTVASVFHDSWVYWSKEISKSEKISPDRLKRWEKYWVPYGALKSEVKDQDREWAEKVIDNTPFKCPIWQCGGIMKAVEQKPPKDFTKDDEYVGDWQTPDLVCTNCGSIYRYYKKKGGRK